MKQMILRAKTFKKWFKRNFTLDAMEDMLKHGVDTGWAGLTWYDDTVKLFEKYKEEMFDKLYDISESLGGSMGDTLKDMMDRGGVSNYRTFANLMTWFMAEETARELLHEKYPNEW